MNRFWSTHDSFEPCTKIQYINIYLFIRQYSGKQTNKQTSENIVFWVSVATACKRKEHKQNNKIKTSTKAIRYNKQLRCKYQIMSSYKYGLGKKQMWYNTKTKNFRKKGGFFYCVYKHFICLWVFILCLTVSGFFFAAACLQMQERKKMHFKTHSFDQFICWFAFQWNMHVCKQIAITQHWFWHYFIRFFSSAFANEHLPHKYQIDRVNRKRNKTKWNEKRRV